MFQVRVPIAVCRIRFLLCLLMLASAPLQAVEQFQSLASLPRDSSPAPTLFQGQDGNLYGILEYTEINHEGETNGVVYQLSTTGAFNVLHRFAWTPDGPPVPTGSEPSHNLAMGKDGFLYGITKFGGAHGVTSGTGVLYRLSPNREYSVLAHLTPYLPGYRARGMVIGPDQAVYTHMEDDGLVRIGFDGSVAVVAAEYQGAANISPYGEDGTDLLVTWKTGGWVNGVGQTPVVLHMRVIELPSGNVKESQTIDCFTAEEYEARFVAVRQDEVIVFSEPFNRGTYTPGRLLSIDRAGNVTQIAEVGGTSSEVPSIPVPRQTLVAADGTIFFTTGQQTKGEVYIYGGTEIHWVKRNGQTKKIGDLDGYPLAAWCEGANRNNIYGVSFGPIVLEDEAAEPAVAAAPEWRAMRAALNGSSAATSTSSSARAKRAAFRYQTDPTNGNFLPIAAPDRYVLPASTKITSLTLPVLRNDRDFEKDALDLAEVGEPKHGMVTIVAGAPGKPPVLSYAPDAGPRLSDTFTYTARDTQGGTAVGQVRIRGVLQGKFRGTGLGQSPDGVSPSVSLESLNIGVAASGRLGGTVRINGTNHALTGKFGADDAAHVHRRVRASGGVVLADLQLENVGGIRHLRYKISYLGQVFEGALPAS